MVVVAILLAAYGVYAGSFVLGMLVAPSSPVLPVAYIIQTILALVAAAGVWLGRSWAANVILALGVVVAATWLIEAFALGIVAYLYAIAIAVVALVLAAVGYAYVCRQPARA
jgi:hypothetical protein